MKRSTFISLLKNPISWAIVIALFLLLTIHPYLVTGPSMYPNFKEADRLLVESISPKLHLLSRGEVIVFPDPRDKKHTITLKRIIGLPNETVKIKDGAVVIVHPDGKEEVLSEKWLVGSGNAGNGQNMEMKLGPEDYFVMGDNRAESTDSRTWGTIQPSEMTGTPVVRLAPTFKWLVGSGK